MSPKEFSEELINFEKKIFVFGFWVWLRELLTFGRKLSQGFKNCISRVHRIFLRNELLQWKPQYLTFSDLERETFQNLANFYPAICQKNNQWLQRSFRRKDNLWVKPRQSWLKLLARVPVLLSTWVEEPIGERNAWIIF